MCRPLALLPSLLASWDPGKEKLPVRASSIGALVWINSVGGSRAGCETAPELCRDGAAQVEIST